MKKLGAMSREHPAATADLAANLGPTEHALYCPGCCPADHAAHHGLVVAGLREAP